MDERPSARMRWNFFARELEDVLAEHDLRLGQLDDRKDAYGRPLVHPEKVRRLRLSLEAPKAFPMLNPEELERVVEMCGLTPEEQTRLHAAILATAVEVKLMDRIHPLTALRATEEIFPILLSALCKAQNDAGKGIRDVIRGDVVMADDEAEQFDHDFHKALDAIDRATMALHLSQTSDTYNEQIADARQSYEWFTTGLRLLSRADEATQSADLWLHWHREAFMGQEKARQILLAFGVSTTELDK